MSEFYFGPSFATLVPANPPEPERFDRKKWNTPGERDLTIISFDPGGTTGWSLLSIPPFIGEKSVWKHRQKDILLNKRFWNHGEIDCRTDESEGIWAIKNLIDEYPLAAVVFEDFQLRQLAADLSPVRIISCVEQYFWEKDRSSLFKQMPSMKATATDDRMKNWGVYTPRGGLQHARDADRHLMIFLRRCLDTKTGLALRKKAWPQTYRKQAKDV